ncbi:unnamed protein product [Tetraodon nigroviridis]|uniref:(spotted green pufferfish) hypothetical protein n=1 Tax=Tetraodon nigroviridis TaxID=99883 RepID=Q4SPB2_TETNG|nr:unnamed protein product [Tetraodon nigroviridis]
MATLSWTRGPEGRPGPALLSGASLLLMAAWCCAAPSGPESESCSTLIQNRFFGFFLSSSVFPSMPCSWTLQNPDPRRYTVFIKVTKPASDCVPSQLRTFQYDSFLETTRTYLGMESFNEVVNLCNTSTPVAFLEAGKQFLQMRKAPPGAGAGFPPTAGDGEFKTEYLVVGKRNPSEAACQMLCQWLEDCLASSTSSRPCGIMQTPCLCWEPPPQQGGGGEGGGCYRNGLYLENCVPSLEDSANGAHVKDVHLKAELDLGGWSVWAQWADCSSQCGGGIQTRTRSCRSPPEESSLCEGVVEEGRPCNPQPCTGKGRHLSRSQSLRSVDNRKRDDVDKPRSGQQSPQTGKTTGRRGIPCISHCSSLGDHRTCRTCPGGASGQSDSLFLSPTPAALIPVNGAWDEWSPWSLCSSTCGRGFRSRTRTCTPPQFGGEPCVGPEKQTKFCNIAVCPVDGVWNEWSSWSSCSASCANGTMQRTRECNGPSYGGSECRGKWLESVHCFLGECPVDGRWQPWSLWSSCSRSCGGGTQQRSRLCYGPFFGGQPCPGEREEVRSCSEKRCPEPHEICSEDNLSSVAWKMTPAGETAAVRCPPNAMGLILRRCALNEEGVAYWEEPTYMKCVSNDYRSIQTLTREHLSKAQRGLVGDGVSEVMTKLKVTSSDGTSYSGDLLAILDVLKNMTEIFRRAYYSPSSADMRNFVQSLSNMLMEENRDRWEEAQLLGPNIRQLFRLVEDFVDVIGLRMKAFQDMYEVTDNLVLSVHKRPVVAHGGHQLPHEGLAGHGGLGPQLGGQSHPSQEHRVHRADRNSTVLNSKILSVTIKPSPVLLSAPVVIDFSHLYNVSTFTWRVLISSPAEQLCHLWFLSIRAPPTTPASPGMRATGAGKHTAVLLCPGGRGGKPQLPPDEAIPPLRAGQVHPVGTLRHPHQLLPVHHLVQCAHPHRTDPDLEQGLMHPDCGLPAFLLLVLLLLGSDGGLAVLHGRDGSPPEPHHSQALPVSGLGWALLLLATSALCPGSLPTNVHLMSLQVFLRWWWPPRWDSLRLKATEPPASKSSSPMDQFCWNLHSFTCPSHLCFPCFSSFPSSPPVCPDLCDPPLFLISTSPPPAAGSLWKEVSCTPSLDLLLPWFCRLTLLLLSRQVNMVIGILVFNKLVSKDGITDLKLKERAGYASHHTPILHTDQ